MPDAKFESGSFSSFRDMMSQNFPLKRGFMFRFVVLFDPKLTHHVNFSNFQAEGTFLIFKIFRVSR